MSKCSIKRSSIRDTTTKTGKENNVKLPKINRSKNNISESVIKEDPSEDNQDKTSIQKISTNSFVF
jgi:hypothetical protein